MGEIKANLSKKDEAFRELSLNGTMWKVILRIGTPLALYQSLNQIFKILDTMMASHISSTSVSAVAYLSQINLMLSAIGGGLAVGAGIQISRAYGEGDYKLVRERVSNLYVMCLVLGVLLLGGILPFVTQFLQLAGTPEELIDAGKQYFIVELITMVVSFMNNVYIAVERARGNSRRILYLNLVVIAIKLSLTAVFVYILNGSLVMIACASLVSQLGLLVFAVINSYSKDNAFGFSIRSATMQKKAVAPMVTQSIPVIVEKMAFSFGKVIINFMSKLYGALTVGALGVSNNIGGITTCPQNGFQEGGAAIISQNLGAKKYKRVLEAFYSVLIINIIIGTIFFFFTMLKLEWLSSLFDGGDEVFHQLIMKVYRYEAFGAVTLGVNSAVLSLLYGMGKTKITLALNFSRVFVFRIPVLWFLQKFTDYGSESVGIVMMVSNVSCGVCAAIVAFFVIRHFREEHGIGRNKFQLFRKTDLIDARHCN